MSFDYGFVLTQYTSLTIMLQLKGITHRVFYISILSKESYHYALSHEMTQFA